MRNTDTRGSSNSEPPKLPEDQSQPPTFKEALPIYLICALGGLIIGLAVLEVVRWL